jgi:hypothetical protein
MESARYSRMAARSDEVFENNGKADLGLPMLTGGDEAECGFQWAVGVSAVGLLAPQAASP